jgi:hypothetical protein
MPAYIWLATGGKQNINLIEKAAGQLQGRKVILVPDLKATADWEVKGQELLNKCKLDISVNKYLERRAAEQERAAGLDLADFLLRNPPPNETAAPQPATPAETPDIERLQPGTKKSRAVARLPKAQDGVCYGQTFTPVWEASIKELEMFFDSRRDNLPESVRVHDGEIVNVPLFIESHLARVRAHNGNPTFKPYLDRLEEVKKTIN